jgi:hypothetical protein
LRRSLLAFGLLSTLVCHQVFAIGQYQVILDTKKAIIRVTACFDNHPAESLTTGFESSADFLVIKSLRNLTLDRRNVELSVSSKNSCSHYTVDLEKAVNQRQATKFNGGWLVNNQAWLWQPNDNAEIIINFNSPQNTKMAVSVPWKSTTLQTGSKTLRASIIGLNDNEKIKEYEHWLTESVFAVSQLYRRFPIDQAQILVTPIGKKREAIPWAEVQRAGLPAVHLFIDQFRPITEFTQDWTTVHELSHLLLPKVAYRDRWLSEGLASYYQNVAKARAGLLTEQQAWQNLKLGFAKGRKALTGNLRTSRSTKHLYWGGAAFYLLADVRLRNLPKPQTLDQVLDNLQRCCLPSEVLWSAEQLTAKLDSLSNSSIFTDLLNDEALSINFPISSIQQNNPNSLVSLSIPQIMRTKLSLVETID